MGKGVAFLAVGAALASTGKAQTEGDRQWASTVTNGGGISYSAPALSPDGLRVYVGVINNSGGGRLAALSSSTGDVAWTFERTREIDASPAVGDDGIIYIPCTDGKLYALAPGDRAASLRWTYSTGSEVATTSPAIGADGTLYLGAWDSKLHAVNPSGTARWTFTAGGLIDSSPAIGSDGTIYFGCNDGNLYAIAPNGTERWRFATGGRIFSSPAIGLDGTIYIGSGDQRMYAVAPDGTKRWDYFTNGDIQSSPVLAADGTVYFAADVSFYALRPGTGDERVRWKVGLGTSSASSAAVRSDGAIIVGGDDGIVRALNPENGSVRWSYNTRTGPGNQIESSPIVANDGAIYVGSLDGKLYKLYGNGTPLSTYSSWPAFRRDVRRASRRAPSLQGGRLANIATRAQTGATPLIAGFVVQGAAERVFLIRAVGPGLGVFGVNGFLPDPRLDLFSGQVLLQSNNDWPAIDPVSRFPLSDTAAGVGAFPLEPDSTDAAIVRPLPPGFYTAHVGSNDGRGGVGLVEIYDARAGDAGARIINLSTRGQVGATGQSFLIAGLVVGGEGPLRLLLRGIGPGLSQFGVTGVLARPSLELFRGATSLGSNSGWTTGGRKGDVAGAAAVVAAFSLPDNSADAAMLFDASPGEYTIQISGVGGTVGEALVEVYVLP